jgi:hypothetical protein
MFSKIKQAAATVSSTLGTVGQAAAEAAGVTTEVVGKAAKVTGNATMAITSQVADRLMQKVGAQLGDLSPEAFLAVLKKLDKACTPTIVKVDCMHYSTDAENYALQVDLSEINVAMSEGKFVRPKIEVHSRYQDLDRKILADRLLEHLSPLLADIESSVNYQKGIILQRQEEEQFWKFLGMFALTLAGAVLGPFLWVIVGIGGWQAMSNLPQLLFTSIKTAVYRRIFGDEISQLDGQLKEAQLVVETMVRTIKILPLTN